MFARKDSPSPTLSERSAKDGRHCDLCGSPSPAVRCDKCGGHCFCLSCDDMYHRHPKRKSHQRKAADSVVPGSGPGTTRRPTTVPGDPSKMPIPPPRKKKGKSIFSFSSSGNEVPALPKKEFSLTEKLGSIRRFMSNRPLPPIPKDEEIPITASKRSPSPRMPAAISAQQALERQGRLPKSRTPSEDGFPHQRPTSPQYQNILSHLTKLAQSSCEEWEEDPSTSGSARGSSGGEDGWGQDTRASRRLANPPPLHPRGRNPMEDPNWTGTGTLRRGQVPFLQHPGGLAAPGMHLSSSATDLTNLEPGQALPQGGAIPGYPYMFPPGVPPLFPHFAPAQSMGRLNYPYYGGSWSNIRNKGTDADEEDDGEDEAEADSKRSTLTRRRHSESKMKRSQSVMYDPNLVPGAYFPFGAMPPGYPGFVPPAPGFPYWGHPDGNPGPDAPSPSSSQRSLTRPHGRSRRRQPDDDSSTSSYAGGSGAPRSSAGHGRSRRRQDNSEDLSSEEEAVDKNPKSNSNPKSNPGSKSKSSSGITTPRGEDKYDTRNESHQSLNHGSTSGSNPHSNPSSNPGHNPGHNPGSSSKDNPGHNPGHNPGPSNSKDNPGHNPGPNHDSNSKDNPGHNPENNPTPTPSSVPTSTWECEFCTFINAPGSRICSICCKSISLAHHDTEVTAAEPMEAKKDINMTEISDEVIKEQERIEKEIRRQIEVQQKLREESPGVQELQISSVSSTEKNEVQTTESKPSSPPPPPCSSPAPALASAPAPASATASATASAPPTASSLAPAPAPATESVSAKVEVAQQEPAASSQPSSGVEIETQTETSDNTFQTEPVKENKPEPRPADVSTQSEDVIIPEVKPQPEFPKILSPSRYDSSCQTNGDLVEFQKDLSVRPKTLQTVSHQAEDISRISETQVERGDQVEMGTSPPPQDFFTQPTVEDVEPQRGREQFGFLHRSLSQTSLNADRDHRRKERFDDGFAPLVRSLSRGSLTSEPGTGGYSGGQSTRHSRGYHQSAFAPVGSGPRNLYTSDWNLHRRTDWDDDGNRLTRLGTSGSWQTPNLERRKSEYFLEELAERRRQEKMRSQGLEMVRMVRKAEQAGFAPDDLQVALANCGDQDPVDWLEENWRNMIETVATLATNYGHDKPDNDVGLISAGEARSALRIQRGNIWAAVTECVETRQRKVRERATSNTTKMLRSLQRQRERYGI